MSIFDDIRQGGMAGTPSQIRQAMTAMKVVPALWQPWVDRIEHLERIALAAEVLASRVEAWDAACERETGGSDEMCEMLIACADFRAAVEEAQ